MPYAAPIVPLIDNPINLDAVIQAIQISLGNNLPWLDYSFGKAVPGYEMTSDGTKRTAVYPSVYAGNNQYQNAGPNNNFAAQSFIQIGSEGERLVGQYDKFAQNTYQANLELIVLFDLNKIEAKTNTPRGYRFTELLKQDIKRVLNKLPVVNSINAIYENPSDVLRGYTYNEMQRQNFAHPFGGLKFALSVSFLESC